VDRRIALRRSISAPIRSSSAAISSADLPATGRSAAARWRWDRRRRSRSSVGPGVLRGCLPRLVWFLIPREFGAESSAVVSGFAHSESSSLWLRPRLSQPPWLNHWLQTRPRQLVPEAAQTVRERCKRETLSFCITSEQMTYGTTATPGQTYRGGSAICRKPGLDMAPRKRAWMGPPPLPARPAGRLCDFGMVHSPKPLRACKGIRREVSKCPH
jgi:hypothetical protein